MKLDDISSTGSLVKSVHVLGDDAGKQASLLQSRDGTMTVIGLRTADAFPPDMATGPVASACLGGSGEVLERHRSCRTTSPARTSIIRNPGLGGNTGAGRYDDLALDHQVREFSDCLLGFLPSFRTGFQRGHHRLSLCGADRTPTQSSK